ncbi:MAG: class I SAM-dependent methyltransferase [Candidatus Nanoarchaeia archaeon]|jgi:SAM-dependent methyltransferase
MPLKTECRLCKGKKLKTYLDLGFHPHSDHFLRKEELNEEEAFYPLRVQICLNCGFHQLDYVVPPKVLYQGEYMYESSITETGKVHYSEMANSICQKIGLKRGSFLVDIGSNVGVLLEGFKSNGMKVLGVDPAPIVAKIANDRGIETICSLFTEKLAAKILTERGKAHAITGTNVFAHIDDLDDIMKAIDLLLTDDGVFIFESPYLINLVENNEYDTIYHQHLSYLSIKPLIPFFNKFGMEIFDVYRSGIHGGSIRVFIGRKGKREIAHIVNELVNLEEEAKVYSLEKLNKVAEEVRKQRLELVSILIELKKQGKKIVGIGAPAKGNTMLNYCALNNGIIEYLTEKSTLKIGRFSPGLHLAIYPDQKILEDKPDYGIILPWNFAEEIIKNLEAHRKNGCKFIIPIPKPKILE